MIAVKYSCLEERIIANTVTRPENYHRGSYCWNWIGAVVVNRSGMKYGKMNFRFKKGPRKGKIKTMLAHRVSLTVFRGVRLSIRTKVLHLCNNSLCCNPMHLEGGSQKRNIQQAVKAGRHKPGTANQYGSYVR